VRAFAAHDHPRSGRVVGQHPGREQPSDLGQRGAVAVPAVSVDRISPHTLGDRRDRNPFAVSDRPPDREPAVHRAVAERADMGEEPFGAARGVGTDQDLGAVTVLVRQLREGLVQDGDVIGGGVRAGVAPTQRSGQELAGVVAESEHRVVAETALERRGRGLLLAVADHDRGVQVDHQHRHVPAGDSSGRERYAVDLGVLGPHHLPRPGPGGGNRGEPGGVESIKQPPARRVRGHRPEQCLLIGEYRDIGDRGGTVGDRDRQVDQPPARIVPGPRTAQPGQGLRQLSGQRCPIRDISQQA
jgi:hypothetical protein